MCILHRRQPSPNGSIIGTLLLRNGEASEELPISLAILKLNIIEGNTYLQCADQKNYYLYVDGETLRIDYLKPEAQRTLTVVFGLSGEGVSFKYGNSGIYLTASGNTLTLIKPITAEQKKQATFIEEAALGTKPGWADVFAGGFYSYRSAESGFYITRTGTNTVGLAAAGNTDGEKLAATFKRCGDQTTLPIQNMRGAVYYPSYAYNAYQTFKYYDPEIIERDMGYAENMGINAFRVWVSYEYWLEDLVHFEAAYNDMLNRADRHGIQLLTSLFDGCGEAMTEKTKARYYGDSYCITSPQGEIFNNPSRYHEPLQFVTWFMERYRNDIRHMAIELYNEPWGENRANLAIFLCKEAVKLQGCVALSGGTAPSDAFSIPKTVEIGMDLIQYHDNFPSSAAAFKSNAISKLNVGKNANLPTYCTEVQWVGGPDEFPEYDTLAPACEELMDTYEWAPFYWTFMVHPGYLKEIRNTCNMTNGFMQEDGNPWSVNFVKAIAPETDTSGMSDNTKSAYAQYYYSHTFSDTFFDLSGKKWHTNSGKWTAEKGYFESEESCRIAADLTDFSDFGVKFTVNPEGNTAGIIVRETDTATYAGGYFGGINNGYLYLGKAVGTHISLLNKTAIESRESYEIVFYADKDQLTLECGNTVVTAIDGEYASGGIGILAGGVGSIVDNISASVNYRYEPEGPLRLGDVDADGVVTVSDVVLLRTLIMNGKSTEKQLLSGDFDGDEKLTVTDVVALRTAIMKG